MSSSHVITVNNLSKKYNLYSKPIDRLKEAFHPFRKVYHHNFYALRDVSFDLGPGEILGIVGKNGSGKSTLLQIITGVLTPTSGDVVVNGKVSALLELGAGFNPELTGLENVYFKSSLLGNSTEETDEHIDEIISFADIGEFINQPVKTYSSGMFVRLAFAVATNVDPDILIVDEALSVGDFRFQQKCLRRINKFREDGKTILFVSHSQQSVMQLCTKAIWLLDGKIKEIGSPRDVCKNYTSYFAYGDGPSTEQDIEKNIADKRDVQEESIDDFDWQPVAQCKSFGEHKAEITRVCFCRADNHRNIDTLKGGIRCILAMDIIINSDIANPILGFQFGDNLGVYIFGFNSLTIKNELGELKAGERKVVTFEFDFPMLRIGTYSFSPAIAEGNFDDNIMHHWVHDAFVVNIVNDDIASRMGHYLIIKDSLKLEVK